LKAGHVDFQVEVTASLSADSALHPQSQMLDYFARVMPEVSERCALSCALDAVRIRGWQGERVDFTHRNGCYPQFIFVGAAAVAVRDGEVSRRTLRRMGMLDRLSVFDDNIALQQRVEELLARASPRAPGPPRAELVRVATASMVRVDANR
jgi:hypothetical protein